MGPMTPKRPPDTVPWWTGPQLDFPGEKIQNREAIFNFFEFVAFEAGHQGEGPWEVWEGLGGLETVDFHSFLNILQNS